MPSNNLTVIAQWTANMATIYFKSDGGSAVSDITQAVGSSVTAPAAPTRAGYTFAGWSPSVPTTMPAGGASLTAQWAQITATGATTSNRTQSSTGTGQDRVWTISADVYITLSSGPTYFHGRVTRTVQSPNVVPVSATITGTTSSGVPYSYTITF
jgi:uncharacterized repeat protein (TIGR02543 family)